MTRSPPSLLAPAIDLGGSSIRAGVVDTLGALRLVFEAGVRADLSKEELGELLRIAGATALDASGRRLPLTVAVPGLVDGDGRVFAITNVPALEHVRIADLMSGLVKEVGVSVVTDNVAAALAEARLGAGVGARRFLCVVLGTGAGAAMCVDGRILDVSYGGIGDAGHVVVDPQGPVCNCGGIGCLDALATGRGIARAGAPLGLASAQAVAEAAERSNPAAKAVLERAGVALGRAIAIWTSLLSPDRVAVTGGIARSGDLLLEPARSELRRVAPRHLPLPEVTRGSLNARATIIGAGLIGLDQVVPT
jgi:glucokinase